MFLAIEANLLDDHCHETRITCCCFLLKDSSHLSGEDGVTNEAFTQQPLSTDQVKFSLDTDYEEVTPSSDNDGQEQTTNELNNSTALTIVDNTDGQFANEHAAGEELETSFEASSDSRKFELIETLTSCIPRRT